MMPMFMMFRVMRCHAADLAVRGLYRQSRYGCQK
jgi:hypothetical protein